MVLPHSPRPVRLQEGAGSGGRAAAPAADYSLKPGEKIHISISNVRLGVHAAALVLFFGGCVLGQGAGAGCCWLQQRGCSEHGPGSSAHARPTHPPLQSLKRRDASASTSPAAAAGASSQAGAGRAAEGDPGAGGGGAAVQGGSLKLQPPPPAPSRRSLQVSAGGAAPDAPPAAPGPPAAGDDDWGDFVG